MDDNQKILDVISSLKQKKEEWENDQNEDRFAMFEPEIEEESQKLQKNSEELLATDKELSKIRKEVEQLTLMKKQKEELMKEDMKEYVELFEDSLFDEAFLLLERNSTKFGDDIIARNKHIRNFFGFIFEDDFFNELLENNRLLPVASSFVDNLIKKEFLKDMGSKLGNFVDSDMISIMYSFLLLNNEFEKAKFLIPFFQANAQGFPKTINEIVSKNNLKALRFVCENMNNIHFNEGSLLRLSSDMSPQALKMLIEEFDFKINEQSKDTGENLVTALIKDKNIKNFQFIVENYSNRVNWGLTTKKIKQTASIFDLIDASGIRNELYEILLDDLTLKSNYIERIANSLFENDKVVAATIETDIYSKLFSHPSFDPQTFNLGQSHLIYGLLSKLGRAATQETEQEARMYLKVLECYLENHSDDSVPEAPEYHVVGAVMWVASESKSAVGADAATLIIRHFPKYINRPNPNGNLPIMQEGIEKDSPLYRLLVNQGAIPLEEDKGFWTSISKAFNKNGKPRVNAELLEKAQREQEAVVESKNTPLTGLRAKMRDDFRVMTELLNNPLCDGTIKLKCENMFLNADRLALMMDKHKVKNAYEDFNFLSENFSNYLKKSLTSYIEICEATVDFDHIVKKPEKLEKAKKQCLENIELLNKQLSLMGSQLFEDVEQASTRDLRVQNKFLKERFDQATQEMNIEDIVTLSNKAKEARESVTITNQVNDSMNNLRPENQSSENESISVVDNKIFRKDVNLNNENQGVNIMDELAKADSFSGEKELEQTMENNSSPKKLKM